MKKRIISISCLVLLVLFFIIAIIIKNNTQKQEIKQSLDKIRLNEVTRSIFYAPQYVSIANGFFKDEGIEIEITTGQGADNVMTSVLSGQCDIGFCGPEASIYVYNEGKEDYVQTFAQLTQKDGSFLISKNPTDSFSWNDLKGKTVIPGRRGGVPFMTLEYVLKQKGINPDTDLTLDDSIKFDLMAGAFTGGSAEYVTLFEPTASMTQDAGKGYIVASVGAEAGEIPYTAYCAKKSYINKNQDLIQRFTNAIYKGQQWVKTHTDEEIAKSIQSFFPDTSIESLKKSVNAYKSIDAWSENPILKEESFNKLQTIISEAGELDKKAPYNNLVNTIFAKNAMKK